MIWNKLTLHDHDDGRQKVHFSVSGLLIRMALKQWLYSSPPLIGTPLLPQKCVLIREVSFGEREHHMHSQYLLPKICVV